MMRKTLATVAGFSLWTALWLSLSQALMALAPDRFRPDGSTDSTLLLALTLAASVLFSLIAGFTTVVVLRAGASSGPVRALALSLLAVGILVQVQYWQVMPLWYHLCFLGLLVPATLLGGRWAAARRPSGMRAA